MTVTLHLSPGFPNNAIVSPSKSFQYITLLSAPRSLRETFDLLSRLEPAQPLDEFLDLVDWQWVTPQQVSYAVTGRSPVDLFYTGVVGQVFDAKGYFGSLLMSAGFQAGIVSNLLEAYPQHERRFFVHIPKSGGTSMAEVLQSRGCTVINATELEPTWQTGRNFIDAVAQICRRCADGTKFYVVGHFRLGMIVENHLLRPGDKIWTVIRPPRDTLLSFLNYILTTLESDPRLTRPDTRSWAASLAIAPVDGLWTQDVLRGLLPALLRNKELLPIDMACHFLGDGTAASAINLLAAGDVEVVDSTKLDIWLEQRFNRVASRRQNASNSFFKGSDFSSAQQRRIEAYIRQDLALHEIISRAWRGGVSTTGMEVARVASMPAASHRLRQIGKVKRRQGRAARPILLDPHFVVQPIGKAESQPSYQGWANPPFNFKSIETTLQLPLLDARIRVRYRRHQRGMMNAVLRVASQTVGTILLSPFKRFRNALGNPRNRV
jgi:hypothetical protein